MGQLDELMKLDLAYNELKGPIPSVFGQLEKLTRLDVSENQLAGTVPSELGQISFLKELILYANYITGSVDTIFCERERQYWLEQLSVDCCQVACRCCSSCDNNVCN